MNTNEKLVADTLQGLIGDAIKKSQSIYTEPEEVVIKEYFGGKDIFAKAIRKFFLQLPINSEDQLLLRTIKSDLLSVLKKNLLPTLNPDAPFFNHNDFWSGIEIKGKLIEYGVLELETGQLIYDYFEQRFKDLVEGTDEVIRLDDWIYKRGKEPREALIEMLARDEVIGTLNRKIAGLILLANREEVSPAEQAKRDKKNSAR